MITSIDNDVLLSSLREHGRKLVVLAAPNYEERSVLGPVKIFEILKMAYSDRISECVLCRIVSLQSRRPHEILDEIKTHNIERFKGELRGLFVPFEHKVFTFPGSEQRALDSFVSDAIMKGGRDVDLLIDISCFPRTLLLQLLEWLFPENKGAPFTQGSTTIHDVYINYSWAESYPTCCGPELIGDIVGYMTGKSFMELLDGKKIAHLVLMTTGSGMMRRLRGTNFQLFLKRPVQHLSTL